MRSFVRFRVVVSCDYTWSDRGPVGWDTLYAAIDRQGEIAGCSLVAIMSLDTLLEAAKFLESSSRGTTKDDSAIARGTVE